MKKYLLSTVLGVGIFLGNFSFSAYNAPKNAEDFYNLLHRNSNALKTAMAKNLDATYGEETIESLNLSHKGDRDMLEIIFNSLDSTLQTRILEQANSAPTSDIMAAASRPTVTKQTVVPKTPAAASPAASKPLAATTSHGGRFGGASTVATPTPRSFVPKSSDSTGYSVSKRLNDLIDRAWGTNEIETKKIISTVLAAHVTAYNKYTKEQVKKLLTSLNPEQEKTLENLLEDF